MSPALRQLRRLGVATALAAVTVTAASAPADGTNVVVSAAIRPGTLSISPLPRRIVVKHLARIAGGWRRAFVPVSLTVVDARGSGAGWALTLSAATHTANGRRVAHAVTSVWGMALRCAACTRPRSRIGFPLQLSATRAVRAFAAARGTGMGRMQLTAQFVITVPKRAPAGPYVLLPRISQATGP